MLKKTLFLIFLLSFSALSFAKNIDSTLIVMPYKPGDWAYHYAIVAVNHNSKSVGNAITLPVSVSDTISLIQVAAMNAMPKIDDTCRNIIIREEGTHHLLFQLENDWLIHCQYFQN
jgi:hypothetical protein